MRLSTVGLAGAAQSLCPCTKAVLDKLLAIPRLCPPIALFCSEPSAEELQEFTAADVQETTELLAAWAEPDRWRLEDCKPVLMELLSWALLLVEETSDAASGSCLLLQACRLVAALGVRERLLPNEDAWVSGAPGLC